MAGWQSWQKVRYAAYALTSCSALLVGESASEPERRPNIVFILSDDQRADAMSCAGNPILKTLEHRNPERPDRERPRDDARLRGHAGNATRAGADLDRGQGSDRRSILLHLQVGAGRARLALVQSAREASRFTRPESLRPGDKGFTTANWESLPEDPRAAYERYIHRFGFTVLQ